MVEEAADAPPAGSWLHGLLTRSLISPHRVDPVPHDAPKPPGYTRFVCVSDTHSRTDPIQMPYGDVLIHAGDFTELGLPSEVKKFNEWLGRSLLPQVGGCAEQEGGSRRLPRLPPCLSLLLCLARSLACSCLVILPDLSDQVPLSPIHLGPPLLQHLSWL